MSDKTELGENPDLTARVESTNELKEFVVQYVGKRLMPENGEITVEMIVEVFADDFPEFLMAIAEENWIRGYHQALVDVEDGEKALRENENTDNK